MDGLRKKLKVKDERLWADQWWKNIEEEWYENDQVLYDMMEDASNNNFVELPISVNSTLQCYPRFPETSKFRIFHHNIEEMLSKFGY